jgi:hypothetical protein
MAPVDNKPGSTTNTIKIRSMQEPPCAGGPAAPETRPLKTAPGPPSAYRVPVALTRRFLPPPLVCVHQTAQPGSLRKSG